MLELKGNTLPCVEWNLSLSIVFVSFLATLFDRVVTHAAQMLTIDPES